MTIPFFDRRNMNFVLNELLDVEQLTRYNYYQEHSQETFDAIIEVAEQIAREYFYPHNAESDKNEPVIVDGRVKIIPEVKEAIQVFAEAGFFAGHHSEELGGIQLPWVVNQACLSIFQAANIATSGYPFLTIAAANLIEAFGSEELKSRYLPPMLDGRCFGTMALTEPQAGSSLSDITTTAESTPEGHYLLRGNKMFISGGEHELSENIVHLVLARIKGAPAGVKGISLFLVPRYHVNPDGSLGEHNDVALSGLLHKMGYRGTTSTALNFGENGRCVSYLIGEPHKGLAYMFQMMNEARIGVGMGAAMLGYAGYLYSLDYARTRPQGRLPGNKDPQSKQVMLVDHADVRRMLLQQKAYVEGAYALGLYAAWLVDQQKISPDEQVRRDCGLLLDILTPIVKAWPSKYCLKANYQAIQILGGYGYTREYPVEQYYRDNRLNPIHEGTNGIQAIDLLGRKVSLFNAAAFKLLIREIAETVKQGSEEASLKDWSRELHQALQVVEETTEELLEVQEQVGMEAYLANASLYLEILGHLVMAWMWLRQAVVASRQIESASASNRSFYMGKLQACGYFFRWELPKIQYQSRILRDMDRTCLDMKDEWF
ncbi:acyl-CoA dehydrogenase [Desulforhopalus singaporensis]|uniref:Butyryl-CoA dehydrogenase n=1 Tax=Desulforhopalus singaporensis TaxID=91360 RepID=A0A1H0UZR7_9BACT|nr:acyl-CoA dehydrogenase [Desulforhopalus singaporensis]SDP71690.1 butyryl-CoA dehydrogenase [Desulforhopalus singaporensis]